MKGTWGEEEKGKGKGDEKASKWLAREWDSSSGSRSSNWLAVPEARARLRGQGQKGQGQGQKGTSQGPKGDAGQGASVTWPDDTGCGKGAHVMGPRGQPLTPAWVQHGVGHDDGLC